MSSKVPSNTTHSLNPYDSMGVAMAGRGKAGTRGMALQPRSEISQLFPLQEGTHPVTPCGGTAAPGSHAKIYPQSVQQMQPSPHRPRAQPQNLTGSCSYHCPTPWNTSWASWELQLLPAEPQKASSRWRSQIPTRPLLMFPKEELSPFQTSDTPASSPCPILQQGDTAVLACAAAVLSLLPVL